MSTVIDNLPASWVYFVGPNLARARQNGPVEAADAAWVEALAGRIDLLQRRLPNGEIAYLAVPRHRIDRQAVKAATTTQCFRRKAA